MAKPTDDISWASSANYPAGSDPWDGQPTTAEPVSGRKASGWEPSKKPGAQQLNWWQRAVWRWVVWLSALFADNGSLLELVPFLAAINARTITRSRLPTLWAATNWTQGSNLSTYSNFSIQCSTLASNAAPIEMDIPALHVLKKITITAKASAGGQGINLSVYTNDTAAVPGVNFLNAQSIGAVTTSSTDFTIHFDASTHQSMTAQTTTNGAGITPNVYTFTRTTGSFVTDGFIAGQHVDSSGWGIAEHNFTSGIVQTVGALTMTVNQPNPPVASVSGAAETLVATVACTPVTTPANGGALGIILFATGSAGVAVGNIAYTTQAPAITY